MGVDCNEKKTENILQGGIPRKILQQEDSFDKIYTNCAWQIHKFFTAEGLFLKQSSISISD